MLKLPSIEERTKFFQNSANLAKTLAFWITAASLVIGYLTVWKYLANNGTLWLFPKVVSDYPFQLFMFGFVIVSLIFLIPFFCGVFVGVLTSKNSDNLTIPFFLATSVSVLLFLLFLLKLVSFWHMVEVLIAIFLLLMFALYDLKGPKISFSTFLKNNWETIVCQPFIYILSGLIFFIALPSSKIFHLSVPDDEIISLIILLIFIALLTNFLGVIYGSRYGGLFSKESKGSSILLLKEVSFFSHKMFVLFENKNVDSYNNIIFSELVIIPVVTGFLLIFLEGNFFDIPRLMIKGTGMGGRSYYLKLDDSKSSLINSYSNLPSCIFIQTKKAFYITKKHDKKSKTFCDSYSTGNSVGPLLRIPKKDVISITPE